MAAHINKWFRPAEPVNADHLLFSAGCTSLCEMLGFTIFEEGEALLLSQPIYQAFEEDFGLRAK
jgi:1-aminocyclopropane-1-carboxylate synthase